MPSTRSRWAADVGAWPHFLVRSLVVVGLGECWVLHIPRSSPEFFPTLSWLPAVPVWLPPVRDGSRGARPDIPDSPGSMGGARPLEAMPGS
jgi:hypothetical protein